MARPTPRTPEQTAKKAKKRKLQSELSKLKGVKLSLSMAASSAIDLKKLVEQNPKWRWANNETNLGDLHTAMHAVEEFKSTPAWWHRWIYEDDFLTKGI